MSEEQIKALAKQLKDQMIDQSKEFLNEIKEEDTEFFKMIAERQARNYIELKFGSDDRKPIAQENLEGLNRAIPSHLAGRALDFKDHGEDQVISVVRTVGRTLLSLALSVA